MKSYAAFLAPGFPSRFATFNATCHSRFEAIDANFTTNSNLASDRLPKLKLLKLCNRPVIPVVAGMLW